MSLAIKTFTMDTQPYKNLELAASMLTYLSPNGRTYRVEDTYFDYGQDWKWTTIIGKKGNGVWSEYQALSPREQERLYFATTIEEVTEAVDDIRNGKYWSDK